MPKNWFNRALPLPKVPLAGFDLGEPRLQTMALSMLCPFGIQECLPKDIHMFSHDAFLRLAPLKYPILQQLNINLASFFVPDRLVLGEDKASELFSSLEPSENKIPKLSLDAVDAAPLFKVNGLMDYLGVQAETINNGVVIDNPMPIFQYFLILRDYYLDENLQESLIGAIDQLIEKYKDTPLGGTMNVSDAESANNWSQVMLNVPFHVAKDRDYFTSGLPTPQRGDDVYIMNPAVLTTRNSEELESDYLVSAQDQDNPTTGWIYDSSGNMLGFDTTVRDLLTKMAYQRFKNTLNQFGTRYNEFLAGNFGVINQDVRLQRAECIGRSKGIFQISEVLQTSSSESDSPLGAYAGRGIGAKRTRNYRYHVNEHGFLFHLASIVPKNGYMSGAPRWFFKESGLDFALPQFNNVGEQPIYKGELFYDPADSASNKSEFAYIDRYSEYRSGRPYASAGMRLAPFTAWHLYEAFDDSVALNEEFIQANNSNRIFNLTDPAAVQNVVGVFNSYHYALRPISYNPK